MACLFSRLISVDDTSADSIVLLGMAMGFALCGMSAWDVIANGHAFDPMQFGVGCGSVLGGIGGGKMMRDRLGKADQSKEIP